MSRILEEMIKESEYKLTQFESSSIDAIEQNIIKKNDKIYIKCLVRDKEVRLTLEEIVRQLYLYKLILSFFIRTILLQKKLL